MRLFFDALCLYLSYHYISVCLVFINESIFFGITVVTWIYIKQSLKESRIIEDIWKGRRRGDRVWELELIDVWNEGLIIKNSKVRD